MTRHRVVVGVLTPVAIIAALAGSGATAWAASPPAPKPPPPAISVAQCIAGHGSVVQTRGKKTSTLKKRCHGGTLNGRKVAP